MVDARFATMRVHIADVTLQRIGSAGAQRMHGEESWLAGLYRSNGERKYCLSNWLADRRAQSRRAVSANKPSNNSGKSKASTTLKDDSGPATIAMT